MKKHEQQTEEHKAKLWREHQTGSVLYATTHWYATLAWGTYGWKLFS